MKKTLLTLTVLAMAGSVALAAEGDAKKKAPDPAKRVAALLKASDTDGDEALSKDEFAASKMAETMNKNKGEGAADKFFGKADADSDGKLSKEELTKAMSGGGKKKKPATT